MEDGGEEGGESGEQGEGDMEMSEEGKVAAAVIETAYYKNALQRYANTNPMGANLVIAGMGAFYALSGLLEHFDWRSADNYYDSYKIGTDTEFYKLGDQVRNFGFMGIGGAVAVMHGLAAFDIMTGLTYSLVAWVALGWMALTAGVSGIKFWAFEQGYKASTGTVVADQAAGNLTMNHVAVDTVRDVVLNGWMMMIAIGVRDSLVYQYWSGLTDEEIAELWDKGGKEVEEKAEELNEDEEKEEGDDEDEEESE